MAIRLSDSETLLSKALDDLEKSWIATAGNWNDSARDQFDKENMEEMRQAVIKALRGMRNVSALLRQVIKECGEDRSA